LNEIEWAQSLARMMCINVVAGMAHFRTSGLKREQLTAAGSQSVKAD
jgi:hypothetical protein